MVELASGGVYISGLGNGTDFSKIIDQMKKLELIPQKRLTMWKADWQKRQDAFGELRTQIASLKTVVDSMNTMNKFLVKSSSSSDPTVATATTDTSVLEGTYSINVNKLATSATLTKNTPFASKTDSVNNTGQDQKFVYTYKNTATRTITVPSGTTLEGLKNMINNDSQNPGVKAMLVQDGSGYIFQFRGMDMGASANLKVEATTDLAGFEPDPAKWNTQQNQDAEYHINGWPGGTTWLKSSSNFLTSAVDGMAITLKSTGATQISVATDTQKIKENIKSFVKAVNELRTKLKELTNVNKSKDVEKEPAKAKSMFSLQMGSVLTGNYGVQLLASRLKTSIADQADGFEYQYKAGNQLRGDLFASLAQIGIMTNADTNSPKSGLLEITEEDLDNGLPSLDKALRQNPTAVAELFAANGLVITEAQDFSYQSHIRGLTKAGIYDVSYKVDGNGKIYDAFIGGKPADVDNTTMQITARDGGARGLAVTVDNLAQNNYSGRVRVKDGKLAEFSGTLKDMLGDNGALKILEDNYQDIMDNIQEKIDKETVRVTKWERHQRRRFSKLEEALSRYDSIGKTLDSMVKGLTSSSS